jgi:hypothetical protein
MLPLPPLFHGTLSPETDGVIGRPGRGFGAREFRTVTKQSNITDKG